MLSLVNSIKCIKRKNNTSHSQTLTEKKKRKHFSIHFMRLVFLCYKIQRHHKEKKRKLQTSIFHKYRYKNVQLNISKGKPATIVRIIYHDKQIYPRTKAGLLSENQLI